jgi:hypothetical protein
MAADARGVAVAPTLPEEVAEDIRSLHAQLAANEREAEALVAGLTAEQGVWRPEPTAWCIAECLDHLATGDRVYLAAMRGPAERARALGRGRRGPARPGWLGALFVSTFEPPPKWWSTMKAPRKIRPRASPPLADAFAAFMASHAQVRAFLREHADLDLAGAMFPNPFIKGLRLSLATGFNVLTAHARRHLWQARGVRQRLESA